MQMFGHKLEKYVSSYNAIKVLGRGSKTQLQVSRNLNQLT